MHVVEEQDHRAILSKRADMDVRHGDVDDVADGYSELHCGSLVYQLNVRASKSMRSYGGILLGSDQPDVEGYSGMMTVPMFMLLMVTRLLVVFVC